MRLRSLLSTGSSCRRSQPTQRIAPEPAALVAVDRIIGQPPPKADVRFQVEAYFLTLELRALLAQVAQARVGVLTASAVATQDRTRWEAFVTFLYDSCIADAEKARTLATRSAASRQAARAAVLVLRFRFEAFRWKTLCKRTELFSAGKLDSAARHTLSMQIAMHKIKMYQNYHEVQKEYLRQRPSKTVEDLKTERKWLEENCSRKVDAWQKECNALEEYIKKGGFYQPLSLQEREEIVKAFGFCECAL